MQDQFNDLPLDVMFACALAKVTDEIECERMDFMQAMDYISMVDVIHMMLTEIKEEHLYGPKLNKKLDN